MKIRGTVQEPSGVVTVTPGGRPAVAAGEACRAGSEFEVAVTHVARLSLAGFGDS